MATINGSTLDVAGIVSQLMSVERRPALRLDQQEASYQARLSAYGNLSSALATFQGAMNAAAVPSAFLGMKAAVGDSDVLSASAGSSAIPGTYAIEVSQLAQRQKLVAAGQAASDTAIGNGTLTLNFGTISGGSYNAAAGTYSGATFTPGTSAPVAITINSANNTLAGIRDAINGANAGVTASIVNDGGTNPFRLVITSDKTGAAQSLRMTVSGDSALSSLLNHDPAGAQNLSEKARALDANFKIDGLSVTKSANSVSDVVTGVTFNLATTNVGAPTTLTVARDNTAVQTLVKNFVDAYNTLQKSLYALSGYDASSKKSGPLHADGTTANIGAAVRSALTTALTGAGAYTTLSQLGVSFQRDGTLALDSAKFQTALATGATDVAAVFSQYGHSGDSLISYAGASSLTQAGSYSINVTQLATRGTTAGSAAANLTITAGVNNTLTVSLDGNSADITLAAGIYADADALALELQNRINQSAALANGGARVSVSQSAGIMTLRSERFGSASGVSITGGNGALDLLGGSPVTTAGLNVAGSIGGVAAVGSGQMLTGAAASNASGLQIVISGGATGSRGSVSYSRGYAYRLSQAVAKHLEPAGTIANRTDGIATSLKSIERQREVLNNRLSLLEQRYRTQYTALDGVLSRMQSTQNFLTQQLDALSRLTTPSNN